MPNFSHRSITGFCPIAVTIITLLVTPTFLRLFRTVSPFMSGRITSSRIRSGFCFLAISIASFPFDASNTSVCPRTDNFSFSSFHPQPSFLWVLWWTSDRCLERHYDGSKPS